MMVSDRAGWTPQEIWQGFRMVAPPAKSDELVAAERAVVEAGVRGRHTVIRGVLADAIDEVIRLRAALAGQGSE